MSKTADKTINQKRDELSGLLAWFESDDFTLEAAVEKFEQAEKLAVDIEAELKEQKNKITVLKQRFDEATTA